MASNHIAWFIPKDLLRDNIVTITLPSGKSGKRNLVGESKVNNAFWHFAVSIKPFFHENSAYLLIRPHVIFTTDGRKPLESKSKMHSLRRSFCRNWWNDKWRDLTVGFLTWLCQKEDVIDITLTDSVKIVIASRTLLMTSPVSFMTDASAEELNEYKDEESNVGEEQELQQDVETSPSKEAVA